MANAGGRPSVDRVRRTSGPGMVTLTGEHDHPVVPSPAPRGRTWPPLGPIMATPRAHHAHPSGPSCPPLGPTMATPRAHRLRPAVGHAHPSGPSCPPLGPTMATPRAHRLRPAVGHAHPSGPSWPPRGPIMATPRAHRLRPAVGHGHPSGPSPSHPGVGMATPWAHRFRPADGHGHPRGPMALGRRPEAVHPPAGRRRAVTRSLPPRGEGRRVAGSSHTGRASIWVRAWWALAPSRCPWSWRERAATAGPQTSRRKLRGGSPRGCR